MLLQRLREYALRQALPPLGCARMPIRYIVQIDPAGQGIQMLDMATEGSRGELMVCPDYGSRTSGNFPIPLADHAQYTLGMDIPKKDPSRTPARHDRYKQLIAACAEATGEPAVQAVSRFLEAWQPGGLPLPEDFDPEAKITFEVVGSGYPAQLASVHRWWGAQMSKADPFRWLECLVCGTGCHPLIILTTQIHGIPGGQPTGMALISGQLPVAESYGLERSQYAPICEQCGHLVTAALNLLLRQPETHTVLGETVYIYWADEENEAIDLMMEAHPHEVNRLLSSPWRADLAWPSAPFFMAALKANQSRVVLCEWMEQSLPQLGQHLHAYFQKQQVLDHTGAYRCFPLWQLTLAGGEQAAPALLQCAFAGRALPLPAIQPLLRHLAKGEGVSPAQAALLRLFLLSQTPQAEGGTLLRELEENRNDPAYLCGRLFAVLETIEWKSQGVISAGVRSYYASASQRPVASFAPLLQRANWHLEKLKKLNVGAHFGLQRQLQEILERLSAFPTSLSVPEQAMFALGYYHQKTENRRQAQQAQAKQTEQDTQEQEESEDSQ
jgi:CRISPR-associated protein Csd1